MTPDTELLPDVVSVLLAVAPMLEDELPCIPEQPPTISTTISHSVSRAPAASNSRPCIPSSLRSALSSGSKLTTDGDAGNVSASAYSRVRKVCGRVTAKAEICRVHHIGRKLFLRLERFIWCAGSQSRTEYHNYGNSQLLLGGIFISKIQVFLKR